MGEYRLKLISGYKYSDDTELELFEKAKLPSNIEYDICKDRHIFGDRPYFAELIGDDVGLVDSITFLVNGFPVGQRIRDGHIQFTDPRFPRSTIFVDNFGYVQIRIFFSVNGEEKELFTKYVSVLVKKGIISESVQRMASFVYEHHEPFLRGNRMSSRSARGLKEDAPQILDSKVKTLFRIVEAYEVNSRFFKTNSKYKVRLEGELVDFEKAQYFDYQTIENIVQRPAALVPTMHRGGIQIRKTTYMPTKVFSKTSTINYDIYENQVIVSFLASLQAEIDALSREIEHRIDRIPSKNEIVNGYFASACFIYEVTKRQLAECLCKLKEAREKLENLYVLYQNLLNVTVMPITRVPRPSAGLLSVQHYRAIYDTIVEWFRYGIYDFAKEDFMLPFIQMHKLYEYYVLTKLCEFFTHAGFEMERRESYAYKGQTAVGEVRNFNTFSFRKNEIQATIYYEPIVNGREKKHIGDNGIGLFRNTTIPFPTNLDIDKCLQGDAGATRNGGHYCPDYIIKLQYSDHAEYIILDAKFTDQDHAKGIYLPNLAYKYIFSLSTVNEEDRVLGLCVVNGKSLEETDSIFDVYNLANGVKTVTPQAFVLTLTENARNTPQLHNSLIAKAIGI